MTMMTISLVNTTKLLVLAQLLISLSLLHSFEFFINIEVAVVSSMLIILGSMRSYYNLVQARVATQEVEIDDELLQKIDDPYGVYEENDIVTKEPSAAKDRGANIKNLKSSSVAIVSITRVIPYAILALGFIALVNNDLLLLPLYLPSLAVGVVLGFTVGKSLMSQES